jgi:hypothetical protein
MSSGSCYGSQQLIRGSRGLVENDNTNLVSFLARLVLLNLKSAADGNQRIGQGHGDDATSGSYKGYNAHIVRIV